MWPPKNELLNESIVRDARDYALSHGLVIRQPHIKNDNVVVHVPLTLFPCPFPRRLYDLSISIQPDINLLMYKVATDIGFLGETLESVMVVDDFTKRIYDIECEVERSGRSQPIMSCISRSDYMLHVDENAKLSLRQVEVNTISSALSSLSVRLSELHEYISSKYNLLANDSYDTENVIETRVPPNGSCKLVCDGLVRAFDGYDKRDTCILVVCEERSLNFSDQRALDTCIFKMRPDISIIRRRFIDLPKCATIGPNQELLLDGNKEVAVVYFRYCYDPENYNFHGAWDMRLMIEKSRAIKCPSTSFHLAGAKKFQQVINDRESLERFLPPKAAERLEQVYCSLWPLTVDERGNKALRMALNNPHKLVLKPQREGGGHNIYKDAIRPFLNNIKNSQLRSQYILMEYIESPPTPNWMITYDQEEGQLDFSRPDNLINELGIYGSVLTGSHGIESNLSAGYLLRGKKRGVEEGGVAAGYSSMSGIYLIEESEEKNISDYYIV